MSRPRPRSGDLRGDRPPRGSTTRGPLHARARHLGRRRWRRPAPSTASRMESSLSRSRARAWHRVCSMDSQYLRL